MHRITRAHLASTCSDVIEMLELSYCADVCRKARASVKTKNFSDVHPLMRYVTQYFKQEGITVEASYFECAKRADKESSAEYKVYVVNFWFPGEQGE